MADSASAAMAAALSAVLRAKLMFSPQSDAPQ
jgi:hypothetical protein